MILQSNGIEKSVGSANEDFGSVVKLPVSLKESTLIGRDFDLRPLYMARQQNSMYYVITVSRQKIAVYEVMNDRVERQIEAGDFPFIRNSFYEVHETKRSNDIFLDNMEKEFYNDADKSFRELYKSVPLPVVVAGDVKTVAYYAEQMDDRRMVIANVHGNFDNVKPHELADAVVPAVREYREKLDNTYRTAIDNGYSGGRIVTDPVRMFGDAVAGNVDTLFLSPGYGLNGEVGRNGIILDDEQDKDIKTRDILHILISDVNRAGGKVVFLDSEALKQADGILMIRRY